MKLNSFYCIYWLFALPFYKFTVLPLAHFSLKVLVHHSWTWMDCGKSISHSLFAKCSAWIGVLIASTALFIHLSVHLLSAPVTPNLSHPSRLSSLMPLTFLSTVTSLVSDLQSNCHPHLIMSYLIDYLRIYRMPSESHEVRNHFSHCTDEARCHETKVTLIMRHSNIL